MEDDSLYNAIIIALIIGIIIVIVTLILARPEPEKFSELYFTDHKSLPKYVSRNTTYNASFLITNHELEPREYNVTITQTLYSLNLDCESPSMYFENMTASTEEPSLYIKDDDYHLIFDYNVRSGDGNIILRLKDIEGNEMYSLSINNSLANLNGITAATNLKGDRHRVEVISKKDSFDVFVDRKHIFYFIDEKKPEKQIMLLYENITESEFREQMDYLNRTKVPPLIFESGSRNIMNLSRIMDEYNLKGILAVKPKLMYKVVSPYLYFDKIKELISKGWKIASNSLGYPPDLTRISESQWQSQYLNSKDEIKKYLDYDATIFIYPVDVNEINECLDYYKICLKRENLTKVGSLEELKALIPENPGYLLKINKSKGFLSFETPDTYADISVAKLRKGNRELMPFYIRDADITYQEEKMNASMVMESFVENPSLMAQYKSTIPINFTDYTVEFYFSQDISFALNNLSISFKNQDIYLDGKKISDSSKIWHRLELDINPEKTKVYFEYRLVAEVDTRVESNDIAIHTVQATIRNLDVRNNQKPEVIVFNLPRVEEKLYTPQPSVLETLGSLFIEKDNRETLFKNYFEQEMITWNNYSISIGSVDKLSLSFYDAAQKLYGIDIKDNKADIYYLKDNQTRVGHRNLTEKPRHSAAIKISNNFIEVTLDDTVMIRDHIDKATNGVLFVDPSDVGLSMENLDSGELKTRESVQEDVCEPTEISQKVKNIQRYIEDKSDFIGYFTFNDDFDVAKVQIDIGNDQEIHFWVMQT